MHNRYPGHPMAPAAPAGVDIQQWVPALVQAMQSEIQNRAGTNLPRHTSNQVLAGGNPANPAMQELIGIAETYLDMLCNRDGLHPQQAIATVAPDVCVFHSAKLAQFDTAMMAQLDPTWQQEFIRIYAYFMNQVNAQLAAWSQQRAYGAPPPTGYTAPPYAAGGGRVQPRGAPPQGPTFGHHGQPGPFSGNGGYGGHGGLPPGFSAPPPPAGPSTSGLRRAGLSTLPLHEQPAPAVVASGTDTTIQPVRRGGPLPPPTPPQTTASLQPVLVTPIAPVSAVPLEPVSVTPTVVAQVTPVKEPNMTPTQVSPEIVTHYPATMVRPTMSGPALWHPGAAVPITYAYDPLRVVPFVVVKTSPDGVSYAVDTVLQPRTEENSMDYEQHANEAFFRRIGPEDVYAVPLYEKVDEVLQRSQSPRDTAELLADLEKLKDVNLSGDFKLPTNHCVRLAEVVACWDHADHVESIRRHVEVYYPDIDPANTVIIARVKYAKNWTIAAGEIGKSEITGLGVLKEMREVGYWAGMRQAFLSLRDWLPLHHWAALNDDFTRWVNVRLCAYLGFSFKIDNFAIDLLDLITAIEAKYGKEGATAFHEQLPVLQKCWLQYDHGQEMLLGHGLIVEADEYDTLSDQFKYAASVAHTEDLVLVPLAGSDMSLSIPGDAGVVSQQHSPNLYQALRYHLANKAEDSTEFRIVMADGSCLNAMICKYGVPVVYR